jgi:hypothetical protein
VLDPQCLAYAAIASPNGLAPTINRSVFLSALSEDCFISTLVPEPTQENHQNRQVSENWAPANAKTHTLAKMNSKAPGEGKSVRGLARGYWSSASRSRFTVVQHTFFNRRCYQGAIPASRQAIIALASASFCLWFQSGVLISVRGDLSDIFLKKSFSSESLVLGYVNEFMCEQR